jgi:2-oxoglutarate ferredoxin oxidoreductase subunit beta
MGKRTKSSPFGSIDFPFNPVSLALGAEASFVARTIDMDRDHTLEMLEQAYAHPGSAFIEIYQNCNVFNDKAFVALTGKQERDVNRINLQHGKPVTFGPDDDKGVIVYEGSAHIVDVEEVGLTAIHVHDAKAESPAAAFALSRLSHGPFGPTPVGVFRSVQRPLYETGLQQQLIDAQETRGPGDLHKLLTSTGSWVVE